MLLKLLLHLLNGIKVIQVIARDITVRKQNEEALRMMHEQYRIIAENMSDLIAVFDPMWNIKYVSPSHLQVLRLAAFRSEGCPAFIGCI
jgi:PAS domain-containing protein